MPKRTDLFCKEATGEIEIGDIEGNVELIASTNTSITTGWVGAVHAQASAGGVITIRKMLR